MINHREYHCQLLHTFHTARVLLNFGTYYWYTGTIYFILIGIKITTKSDNAIQDNDKLAIIGGVAGALLLSLLLVIAVIIIILICKVVKSRNKQSQLINELSRYLHSDLDMIRIIIIVFLHAVIMKGITRFRFMKRCIRLISKL